MFTTEAAFSHRRQRYLSVTQRRASLWARWPAYRTRINYVDFLVPHMLVYPRREDACCGLVWQFGNRSQNGRIKLFLSILADYQNVSERKSSSGRFLPKISSITSWAMFMCKQVWCRQMISVHVDPQDGARSILVFIQAFIIREKLRTLTLPRDLRVFLGPHLI